MKYLFFLIFSLNIIFYIFLIYKPLNIESDFSIEEGNNLNEIFASLEEKNIYFPKAIKLIFNVSGTDKKIYLGKYKIDINDSLIDIFKNIYFGKIILKKFIISEGSKITDLFSNEIIKRFCQTANFLDECELEGYAKPDVYLYDREIELLSILKKSIENQMIDLNKSEAFTLTCLAIPTLYFGFYPEPLINTIEVSIRDLIDTYNFSVASKQ